jgi:hypothetical protein
VELVQHIFETSNLSLELNWSVLVAIPKRSGGCRAIGLLEIIWKLISSIIDSRLKQKIILHPALHGFRPFRERGGRVHRSKSTYTTRYDSPASNLCKHVGFS